MYAGAALSLVGVAVSLTAVSRAKRFFEQSPAPITASELNDIVFAIVAGLS
jgi:hypothetical protein